MNMIRIISNFIWKIIKIEVFIGVIAGMIFSEFIHKEEVYRYFTDMDLFEGAIFLSAISFSNWKNFALILILVIIVLQDLEMKKQRKHLAHIKIGMSTLLDYFKLNSKINIPNDVYEGHVSEYNNVIDELIGGEVDYSIRSKATRNKKEVDLFIDTKNIINTIKEDIKMDNYT